MDKWGKLKEFFIKSKSNADESITIKICDIVLEKIEELEREQQIGSKDNITINSIEPVYETKQYIGEEPTKIQTGLVVKFEYKNMTGLKVAISTDRIDVEEIKDKIIEVLQ